MHVLCHVGPRVEFDPFYYQTETENVSNVLRLTEQILYQHVASSANISCLV